MIDECVLYKVSLLTSKVTDAYQLYMKISDKMWVVDVITGNSIEQGKRKIINIEECNNFYVAKNIKEFNELNNK